MMTNIEENSLKKEKQVIAVTGATGTIGSELLNLLSSRNATVKALSRHPEKVKKLPGIEWIAGDLADRENLTKNFDGVDTIFLLTGNVENMVYVQQNAIKAAVDAGVKRIVKLSALGASEHSKSVIGLWHFNVERALLESGLEWTILRPHAFMQNFLEQVDSIREGKLYSAAADGKVPFIDTRDIAAVAAEILINGGWNEKKIVLTGPDAISFDEVAEILSNELGNRVEHIRENDEETWKRIYDTGKPTWLIAGQLALYNYWRDGGTTAKTTNAVEQITGKAPRSFTDFVREYKNHFTS